MPGPFAPFTGGRISEVVNQEAALCKSCLPSSRKEDKVDKFCKDYENFISVPDAHKSFISSWEHEKKKVDPDEKPYKMLLRCLWKSFRVDFFKAFLAKLTWSVLVIWSIYYFVFDILDFINKRDKGTPINKGEYYEFYLCGGFFATMFVLSIGIQQMGIYSSILGSKVKAALTTEIYKKMIVRDPYGSKADIVALVAKDVEKLAEACLSLQYLWSGIFETLAAFAVTLILLGATILPGVAMMAIFMPLQYYMGMVVAYRKKDLAVVSDERISLMEEIMRSIKLIKIYGWEASFFKNLNDIRAQESRLADGINNYKSTILGLIFSLPPMLCVVIFGTKEAMGDIESVVVFTAMSFFNTLRVPFSKLPKSLRDVLDALSSMERIQAFLLEPELSVAERKSDASYDYQGITFRNACMSYGMNGAILLNDVNMTIPQGSLVMVAGPVASGKSNLLKAILGDMTIRSGQCLSPASKAYVPQTPWTALGTVRDNIVFGLPFDEAFYRRVIFACALEPDLKMMPLGDQTWIGERGGNLSGGQKQRIALARAAYSRAKLYVLDSPLSAVDMYTCQHIFKLCIKDMMIAGGGTVVLATHQTELFAMSDHLVVMKENKVAYNAKYSFKGIKHLFPNFCGDEVAETTAPGSSQAVKHPKPTDPHTGSQDILEHPDHSVKVTHDALVPLKPHAPMTPTPSTKKLVTKTTDHHDEGSIYLWYIQKIGVCLFTTATLIFVVGQIFRVYSDNWVSVWTKRKYEPERTADSFYAGLYGLLVFVFLCMSFLRAFFYFRTGKVGAMNIHDAAFAAALKAPMHFFHVTPVGKLLAFFSKDVEIIDDQLVDNVLMFQIMFWIFIMACGVVAYNLIFFLAIVAALGVVYIYTVYNYIQASMPLMRAAEESGSHVVAHTAETLSGLAVVRAFRMEERFVNENVGLQAKSAVSTFSIANLSLWLAFRVDLIGALLVLGCCLLAVIDTSMDAPIAGLIVSNSFQILLFFSIMSRLMGDFHDNMKSVNMAREICNLEAEQEPEREVQPPANWPAKGEICFEGVVMPYLPGQPPTLKGINFTIKEGEKIGVVGRTGAGKSSLIVALYRLAEISEGRIRVDNVDCSMVNLHKLRSSMAIIPQEPVMFSGTLRYNLDPFNQHTDEALWDVLGKCLLGPVVRANKDGLNARVEMMGSNFSLGTQQLICLARAMLNPSRVLLLDEATAALDSDTNAAVQQVLQQHFSHRTIFTIAHRLDTIIDSDRILVMNAGVVAEFDTPHNLLEKTDSIFHELCMNTGRAQFEVLAARARTNVAY
jgi:ABC-type multidrug transport system fused ATPase/permease subunit